MAFVGRIGSVLRQTVSKNANANMELCASNSMLYQAVRSMSTKLFVGGLSFSTDEQSLQQAFSQHGQVNEVRIIQDRDTGRSRGFGFVTFASEEDAQNAMQAWDSQELHGRKLRVNVAIDKPRTPRYDNYGGGGGFGGNYGGGGGGFGGNYGGGGGNYSGGAVGGGAAGFGVGSTNPGGFEESPNVDIDTDFQNGFDEPGDIANRG